MSELRIFAEKDDAKSGDIPSVSKNVKAVTAAWGDSVNCQSSPKSLDQSFSNDLFLWKRRSIPSTQTDIEN